MTLIDSQSPIPQSRSDNRPITVSVIMPNYNGSRFLGQAIRSVLTQSLTDLELIIIDDCSTDTSLALAMSAAASDPRVHVLSNESTLGPAGSRNRGLAAARGEWIAVVDSDDFVHPKRFEQLVALAQQDGADIAADDLLVFDDSGRARPQAMLVKTEPDWIDLATYIVNGCLFARGIQYGYLKPIFRKSTTFDLGISYNPTLRIAEDYDLVSRMMFRGARLRTYPQLTYFYRKHANSISHRLSLEHLDAMLVGNAETDATIASFPEPVIRARQMLKASIERAIVFTRIVAAMKRRQAGLVFRLCLAHPAAALNLRLVVAGWFRRRILHPLQGEPIVANDRDVCLISRQRVTGAGSGSGAYLLSLCRTMTGLGFKVHFVGPSPTTFGRWPAMVLRPEMAVFSTIRIRGGIRLGRVVVATDPMIALRAARLFAVKLLKKVGLFSTAIDVRAPYAVASPWKVDDFLYIAQYARRRTGRLIVADYAFLTGGFPYALQPDARTAVVMHDLISSRSAQFAERGQRDSIVDLDADTEYDLLSQADVIIAIQPAEAETVRQHLPRKTVITAPMAITPAPTFTPGDGKAVLFVGTSTSPNLIGLRWFLAEVWPTVLAKVPDTVLRVAGGAGEAVPAGSPRVEVLGRVPDLAPVYKEAAIVISPLLMGSGLKIKVMEAMAYGKAIVATPTSLAGFGEEVQAVVCEAESAAAFSAEIVALLEDPVSRRAKARATLDVAMRLFSPEIMHAELSTLFAPEVGSA